MSGIKSHILVVDDDKNLSKILVNILDYEGYQCEFANDGKTATRMINKKNYDLLLLDLALPDISGLEVLQNVVSNHNNYATQIVMIY